jgi:uncharacterized protein
VAGRRTDPARHRLLPEAIELQRRHAGGRRIINALQTNGTLLDDAWGAFLKEHGFLVGLSLDGPRALHDAYRVDKRQQPTFDRVLRGLRVLQKHAVDFNTLTVVNHRNVRHPLEVYRFLKDTGSGFLQFIPLVERKRTTGRAHSASTWPPRPSRASHPPPRPSPPGASSPPPTVNSS